MLPTPPDEISWVALYMPFVISLDLTALKISCKLLFDYGNRSVFTRSSSTWILLNRRSIVILAYDTLLTFSREFDCIWKRKMSAASIIFTILRYVALAANIVVLVARCPMELILVRASSRDG